MKINSVADLKRLPIGTKLALVERMGRPLQNIIIKSIHKVGSQDITLITLDSEEKSYIPLKGMSVSPVFNQEKKCIGFKISLKENPSHYLEYKFV